MCAFHPNQQLRLLEQTFDPMEMLRNSLTKGTPWNSISEFATSDAYCGLTLYPRQHTLLKLVFLETENMTAYDLEVIEEWRRNFTRVRDVFGVQPDIWERVEYLRRRGYRRFPHIQFVLGRRASKGYLGAIIITEMIAYLISLDNPQAHYGIMEGKDVFCNIGATSQTQAQRHQFADVRNVVEHCKWLEPYIAETKDHQLRLRTPADLRNIAGLKAREIDIEHTIATLWVVALSASSVAGRGATSYVNAFDEFAFLVSGSGSVKSSEEIYEDWQPSLGQFKKDALTLVPSSPFCLDVGMRVLTEDLRWVRVDSLEIGDKLIGFDEEAPPGKGQYRAWRQAVVTDTSIIQAPRYAFTTESGKRIVCTGEHLWLAKRWPMKSGQGNNRGSGALPPKFRWIKTFELRPGDEIKALGVDPWETDESRDGGYLAGIFDGEGHYSGNGTQSSLGVGQNVGETLDGIRRLLKERDFDIVEVSSEDARRTAEHFKLRILGGFPEIMRFLGTIRPARLLPKLAPRLYGSRTYGNGGRAVEVVTSVEQVDDGPVVALETSTKTLIAEGMFSHNTKVGKFFELYQHGRVLMKNYRDDSGLSDAAQSELRNLQMRRDLDEIELGAEPGMLIFQGSSWAQPINTPVLTPQGWRPMGQLQEGDFVIGSDGQPTKVTGVIRRGVESTYRVTMNDGSSTKTSSEHLWAIQDWNERACNMKPRGTVASTEQIAQLVPGDPKHPRTFIPMVQTAPIFDTVDDNLPVPAYLLGYLLGDGCFRVNNSPRIALVHPEENALVEASLHEKFPQMKLVFHSGADWGIVSGYQTPESCSLCEAPPLARGLCSKHYHQAKYKGELKGKLKVWNNPLGAALRDLGLMDLLGPDKFVPEQYFFASPQNRLALLQGLMDSDGTYAGKNKHSAIFFNVSEELCKGVVQLTESLGGQGRMYWRPARKDKVSLPSWHVSIRLPGELNPFRLSRKAEAYQAGVKTRKRAIPVRKIVSVEPDGQDEMQCIEVAAKDGLYVTEHYIVTHNCLYQDWERGPELVQVRFSAAPENDLRDEEQRRKQLRNPDKFAVERLGQFAEVMGQYLDSAKVDAIFKPVEWRDPTELSPAPFGRFDYTYRIHVDPSKTGANFALCIAHTELAPPDDFGESWPHVIIDRLHVWQPKDFPINPETGKHEVDYTLIERELDSILYTFPSTTKFSSDQWNSAGFLQRLKKKYSPNIRVVEETATEKTNYQRAEKFKSAVNLGWVHSFKDSLYDDNQCLLELECKFLSEKCYDDQTEVLTENGWCLFRDVAPGARVATRTALGELEWHLPVDFIAQDFRGQLYTYDSHSLSFAVTPQHRMLVDYRAPHRRESPWLEEIRDLKHDRVVPVSCWSKEGPEEFVTFGDWPTWQVAEPIAPWTPWSSDDLAFLDRWYPTNRTALIASHLGRKEHSITAVSLKRGLKKTRRWGSQPLPPTLHADVARFMGMWLADGNKTGHGHGVVITQIKPRGRQFLEDLLSRMEWPYTTRAGGAYVVNSSELKVMLQDFVGPQGLRLSPGVLADWPMQSREALLEGFLQGDGLYSSREERFIGFVAKDESLANDIQALAATLGLHVRLLQLKPAKEGWLPLWRGHIKKTDHALIRHQDLVRRDYDGKIYCLTVPNNTLMVRRNGKTMWCGNSGKVFKQEFGPVTTKDLYDAVSVCVTDLLHESLERWSGGELNAHAVGSTNTADLRSGRASERAAITQRAPGAYQDGHRGQGKQSWEKLEALNLGARRPEPGQYSTSGIKPRERRPGRGLR